MISRVKSLEGLIIMRPFNKKRICCRWSEDVRREFARLRMLELLTLVEHGSDIDVRSTRDELTSKGLLNLIGQEYTDIDMENVNLLLLNLRQAEDDRLTELFDPPAAPYNLRKHRLLRDTDHFEDIGLRTKKARLTRS